MTAYKYTLEYRLTAQHGNADGLSKLPLTATTDAVSSTVDCDIFSMAQIEALPVTAMQLRKATRQDPTLSQVITFTKKGWPSSVPEELKPFWAHRNELTITFNDCHADVGN